jgi:hypothetical protein
VGNCYSTRAAGPDSQLSMSDQRSHDVAMAVPDRDGVVVEVNADWGPLRTSNRATVKTHSASIYSNLGVTHRNDAVSVLHQESGMDVPWSRSD